MIGCDNTEDEAGFYRFLSPGLNGKRSGSQLMAAPNTIAVPGLFDHLSQAHDRQASGQAMGKVLVTI